MIITETCRIERYPCWDILRITPMIGQAFPVQCDTLERDGQTWFIVDVGIVDDSIYVVPTRKEQQEIRISLMTERMR